jgi:hypothetical protein
MAARHIPHCQRCGVTIKASEAYIVRPELVTRFNSRGRRFSSWTARISMSTKQSAGAMSTI